MFSGETAATHLVEAPSSGEASVKARIERVETSSAKQPTFSATAESSEKVHDVITSITFGFADVTPYHNTIKSSPSNERILGGVEARPDEQQPSAGRHDDDKLPRLLISLRKVRRRKRKETKTSSKRRAGKFGNRLGGSDAEDEVYEILKSAPREEKRSDEVSPAHNNHVTASFRLADGDVTTPLDLTKPRSSAGNKMADRRHDSSFVIVTGSNDVITDPIVASDPLSRYKNIYGESSTGVDAPYPSAAAPALSYRSRRVKDLLRRRNNDSSPANNNNDNPDIVQHFFQPLACSTPRNDFCEPNTVPFFQPVEQEMDLDAPSPISFKRKRSFSQ